MRPLDQIVATGLGRGMTRGGIIRYALNVFQGSNKTWKQPLLPDGSVNRSQRMGRCEDQFPIFSERSA